MKIKQMVDGKLKENGEWRKGTKEVGELKVKEALVMKIREEPRLKKK